MEMIGNRYNKDSMVNMIFISKKWGIKGLMRLIVIIKPSQLAAK